jgi:peptidoglycan/LPS O-acetylase OafA/YrhL
METGVNPPPDAPSSGPQSWLSRFIRVTSSGRFIPEIDGFRFIAIASVFCLHDVGQVLAKHNMALDSSRRVHLDLLPTADRWLGSILWTGGFGVQLFFVISGFILALPFAEHRLLGREKPLLRAYYLRRVTRLEPPYMLNLIFGCLALGFVHHWRDPEWHPFEALRHLGASMLYLHNQIFGYQSTINGATWSLEIEIQFYILAPLLGCLFLIRKTLTRRIVLIALCLAFAVFSNCATYVLGDHPYRYRLSIANALQYFLAGFILADIYLVHPGFLRGTKSLRWDFVALLCASAGVALVHFGGGEEGIWGNLPFALPFLVLLFYIAGFKSILFNKFLNARPIFLIGGMCYSIYLYHGLMLDPLNRATRSLYLRNLPLWANVPIQFALHAAVAAILSRVA